MQPDFTNAPEIREANELVARAQEATTGYKITTVQQYEDSAGMLRKIKAGQKRLEELRTSVTAPLNAALRAANDLFRGPAEKLAQVERAIKGEITRYADEQEQIRREEQRKADEAARRERERLAAQAARAAAAGKVEKAADLEQRAETVVAPTIVREPPRVAGIATREVWHFEITDPSKINAAFLMPDEKKIRAQVQALKGEAAALIGAGVRVWSEQQIAARAG